MKARADEDPCGEERLLARLRESPLDYRSALGVLDPEHLEWRDEGKPEHDLTFVADVPLLMVWTDGVCHVLAEPDEAAARAVAEFVSRLSLNELCVLGDAAFRVFRPLIANGRWRWSREYGVTAEEFRPRTSDCVRRLEPDDRSRLERACQRVAVLRKSQSTKRDFDLMARGFPVVCYGAFAGEELVGFCSSNPIYRGVTEISWLAVSARHRRQGLASGLLTAQAQQAFARGDAAGYYAGSAGDHLHAMLLKLGFRELLAHYRFIPEGARDQWRADWGKPV
ncbi:MAG: GNAT family N-acetyltransferase [Armatimonadota bacterium]|nr:MAG: GNAT family N-acetyltransferase [Armatimonadota bacterium]